MRGNEIESRIGLLSEQQKVCLRHVSRGLSSKEIAQETGLSPQTVDTYLKAAMARLEVGSRREAARLLAASEIPQPLGSPSLAVEVNGGASDQASTTTGGGLIGLIVPPPVGGRRNLLGPAERNLAILKVAMLGALVVLALALLIAGALRTFR